MDSTERSIFKFKRTSRPREQVESGRHAPSVASRGRRTQDEQGPLVLPETIKMEANNNECAARGQSGGQEMALSCRRAPQEGREQPVAAGCRCHPRGQLLGGAAVAELQLRPRGSPPARNARTQPRGGPLRTCLDLPLPTTHSGGRELWHG